MSMQAIIDEGEKYLLHAYNRNNVVFDRGEGVYLYDIDGKSTSISVRESLYLH